MGERKMRIAVTVLNVLSSLASLLMVWFGSSLSMLVGRDYFVFDMVVVATFLIIPSVCVVASTRLVRHRRGLSIFVSLVPVVLVPLVLSAYCWTL